MGDPATFAGANHQTGVIAYVFAHVLAHRRLGWLTPIDDTPSAVSAETGGPGDDVRVECTEGRTLEVQAKAGLTGEAALREAMLRITNRTEDDPSAVVLAVDRRSSRWIYHELATDLERIRGGRLDVLAKLVTSMRSLATLSRASGSEQWMSAPQMMWMRAGQGIYWRVSL